ncbi:MAG: AbrB/MazE/SpoVT family DNA-binding domain-containing protein [Candidatus Competibacter sp.]|jgi:antitoxin VapB|nr:AbrB/MazE/SpoVT family DNA-binding domain-containing protein [Candidatus Competibacter sp.]
MQTAKIFRHGGSQAVRLPAEFRFDAGEVFVWRDATTGNVVLSTHAAYWADFLALRDRVLAEDRGEVRNFSPAPRDSAAFDYDPFAGWQE